MTNSKFVSCEIKTPQDGEKVEFRVRETLYKGFFKLLPEKADLLHYQGSFVSECGKAFHIHKLQSRRARPVKAWRNYQGNVQTVLTACSLEQLELFPENKTSSKLKTA